MLLLLLLLGTNCCDQLPLSGSLCSCCGLLQERQRRKTSKIGSVDNWPAYLMARPAMFRNAVYDNMAKQYMMKTNMPNTRKQHPKHSTSESEACHRGRGHLQLSAKAPQATLLRWAHNPCSGDPRSNTSTLWSLTE